MALKPYLQLIRLPNVFTAAADSLAGWVVVRGSFEEPRRWLPLAAASMAIYAAGIALNDVFDYQTDLAERPGRPLPSGRVSRRFAAILGGVLLAAGPLLAAASGSATSAAVASGLALCVLGYDLGLKRTLLGPELMGACRGLNILLGASQAPALGGPRVWLFAGALAVFVSGLTWISRHEAVAGRRGGAILGSALQGSALLALLALCTGRIGRASAAGLGPGRGLVGLAVLAGIAWVVGRVDLRAIRVPDPTSLQGAVKTGVLSLVWLDVGVVAALMGTGYALVVAALWIPAYALSRRIYST